MRRYWILLISVLAISIAAACGSDGPSTPSPSVATSVPPTATVAPTPTQGPTGSLEVRVTDQPGEVSAVVLTVRNIEVNRSSGDGTSGWLTVLEGPFEFDLVQLDGIEEILGSANLEVGRYGQIRLEVVSARVTIPNGTRTAGVPSGKLRLVGGFEVVEGETTIVTLDFDAQRSIVFIPMRGPQLMPVVKLLVRMQGQSLAEANSVASIGVGSESGSAVVEVRPAQAPRASADGLKPVRVVVPTADNLSFMSFWIALGAGYFRDEGLDVQVIVPPNPLETGNFLLQGRADVAVMPPPKFLPMIASEDPIVVFGNLLQNDAINLIVRPEVMVERGLSADMPLEERLRGISGLKVGVSLGPPTRLRVLFNSVGLDADRDIEMVIIHGAEQNQAFEDGLVDALYTHTPYLERALIRQGAVMLVNQSAGEVAELGGQRQSHGLVTTRAFAGSDRDVLVKFIRAIGRAQELAHTDLAATVQAVLDSGIPDLDRELVETIVAIYAPAIPATPVVSVVGVARALELFPAHREPPDLSGINLDAYVDTGILEEAESQAQGSIPPP